MMRRWSEILRIAKRVLSRLETLGLLRTLRGRVPWGEAQRDLELRKAGQFSRIISSKLKGKAPLKRKNQ